MSSAKINGIELHYQVPFSIVPSPPAGEGEACPERSRRDEAVPTTVGRCIRVPIAFRPTVGAPSPESSPIKEEEHSASLPNRLLRQALLYSESKLAEQTMRSKGQ